MSLEVTVKTLWQHSAPDYWEQMAIESNAHYFQGTAWSSLVAKNYHNCNPLWITAFISGKPVGGLVAVSKKIIVFKLITSNFDGTLGGPFCITSLPDASKTTVLESLISEYLEISSNFNVIESAIYTNVEMSAENQAMMANSGFEQQKYSGAIMPLQSGYENIEMNLVPKNRRNERNRSLKRGCVAGVTSDPEIIEEYYPVYLESASSWGVTPVPKQFMKQLLGQSDGSVFMTYVRHEEKFVGGHLNFHGDGIVTAWNGATDKDDKSIYPASVLIFKDIEEACNRGCKVLDLGAHGGVKGVSNFKKMFGAESDSRLAFRKTKLLKKIINKIIKWSRY